MYFQELALSSLSFLNASKWWQSQARGSQSQINLIQEKILFDWDATPAHKHLIWHDCFNDFKCARLEVPMDWQQITSEANKTVELALIKVEATVPVTDKRYGGALVMNPGGPGGSGVNQVLTIGYDTRTLVSAGPDGDKTNAKHFDIIGFDPRGVNNTRPLQACFPNHQEVSRWTMQASLNGKIGSSDAAFDLVWASTRALAEGCSQRLASEGIGKHMSTAPVARDIIEIVERHGEWREKEARRLTAIANLETVEREAILERTTYVPGKEKVTYWGFSYGTLLGATLVAMFPERIERAILDGVVDAEDYMAAGWRTNLVQTDELIDRFAKGCVAGGPENCRAYQKGGPSKIISKITETVVDLKKNPISIPGDGIYGPQVVTFNDLMRYMREVPYSPLVLFPETARILSDLGNRNGSSLAAWVTKQLPPIHEPLSDKCKADGPYSPSCFKLPNGRSNIMPSLTNMAGIACSDGMSLLNRTKEDMRVYADELMETSKIIGASWAEFMMACTAWQVRPAWRYEGDFHSEPAHPPLFIGNTIDPVTPLRNAYKMAKGFQGAAVLHLDSIGHCTTSGISLCAGKAIREYLQAGVLPGKVGHGEYGFRGKMATCSEDRTPLDGYTLELEDVPLPKGEKDVEMWKALIGLNRAGM